MSQLDEDALNALAESMAAQVTEDPQRKMLITEAFRILYADKFKRGYAEVSVELQNPRSFALEVQPGRNSVLWNFYVVAQYMERAEFLDDGSCIIHNARVGASHMSKECALEFRKYLSVTYPEVKIELGRLPQSANDQMSQPVESVEKSANA
jgi:hypothetical protein